MRRLTVLFICLTGLVIVLTTLSQAQQHVDSAALNKAFEDFSKFEYGDNITTLNTIDNAFLIAQQDKGLRRNLEKRFIAILQTNATVCSKKYACDKLSSIGSVDAVAVLKGLLDNSDFSHSARIALERLADPVADKALLDALPQVKGKLKIGLINSLGSRKNAKAVDDLRELLNDPDKEIVHAAVCALGKIDTPQATQALLNYVGQKPPNDADVVTAQLLALENLTKAGKYKQAREICETLYGQNNPEWIRLAGFKGLVETQPEKARTLLLQALADDDTKYQGFAAQFITEMPLKKDLAFFFDAFDKLPPSGQVALIDISLSVGEKNNVSTIRNLSKSDQETVRIAACQALGRVGGPSDVLFLAEVAAAHKGAESIAAYQSLVDLTGQDINPTMLKLLDQADAPVRVVLIETLALRSADEALDIIAGYINDPDKRIRTAAIKAIGGVGNENHISALVVLMEQNDEVTERTAIKEALKSICGRIGEKCSRNILSAYNRADKSLRLELLELFALVGSSETLDVLRSELTNPDETIRNAGIQVLVNWPHAEAMKDLESIVANTKNQTHYVLAFRGFIRLVRLLDEPTGQKVSHLTKASSLSRRPEETRLILAALGGISGSIEALKVAEEFLNQKDVIREAVAALLEIAGTLDIKFKDDVARVMKKVLQLIDDENVIQNVRVVIRRFDIPIESL